MDEKKICSDFLFSNSSFITGAATIFNLSGDFYDYNSSASDIEADQKAICNDFKVVGEDLKSAIEEFTL
ncbi:hypothetical protein [Pedobacter borealis]|uniref:hypothetical protein n=1 Tax=Pedobacter borealis TaxID=475254 RepID=UPI0004935B51|nr:hypothetical protein [Pedobacter borealis]